ncbi:hypothetical protein CRYUN_Cryun06bG0119000 [Craigia yunnanensis]
MADAPSPLAALDINSQSKPDSDNPNQQPAQPDLPLSSTTITPLQSNPNPNTSVPPLSPQHPPAIPSYSTPPPLISGPATAVAPAPPSFRPVPQFSPLPNFQAPGVQPPGVSVAPGPLQPPLMQYQVPMGQVPNPALRPFAPIPNGYAAMPRAVPHGVMPPPGLLRYPSPYPTMIRPAFPPRPPGAIGVIPTVSRPPVPGVPGFRPISPLVIRPAAVPNVTPAEKPQTTVYVGKIAPTVDNDFMLSLLRLCGPVKSWKRAQDPTNGTPKGFGFCEFESAEGVLQALRLLGKFNIDGQELVLNINQATRYYLERYVVKKSEIAKKLNEAQAGDEKEGENAVGDEKNESSTPSVEDSKKDSDTGNKENIGIANLGIVTDEDCEADRDASEKLASMIEERLKTNPLPPPPRQTAPDGSGKSNSDLPAKSRDGDSDIDVMRNDRAEGKNDDETTSESKATTENDRPETSSPDRRYDRSRDREQDLKREKEREIERLERETDREKIRKEREQRRKIEEAEREYENMRRRGKKRGSANGRRRFAMMKDDDDDSRKRWRRSALEEKRRKRLREKEDDLADRLKVEKEIAEAKKRAEEERDASRLLSGRIANGGEKTLLAEEGSTESKDKANEQHYERESRHENRIFSDGNMQNGSVDESNMVFVAASDTQQSVNAPARRLGFGLVGSGKRTTVPSVFHEEEDDAQKEKKMRPLVPIDYSTEELKTVQPGTPPANLVAAAEFAKRISNVNHKEEKPDAERERSRRSYGKSIRDKDRNDEDNRTRDKGKAKIPDRDRDREHGQDKVKTTDNQKLLDAKQLIDMIPKTKEELFSYEINWDVYDQHTVHERMKPWISKKITEFLGEEEKTLVDYIVSSTQEHVKASQMLELLQSILDEEAEMFVLKMWRMLIFEIKKVEIGLALRSRA